MSWIDAYLKAFANAVAASSAAGWFPFSWYRLCPYIADLDVARWQKILLSAKQKNLNIDKLAGVYHGPLAPRFEIHYMMYECKAAGVAQSPVGISIIDFLNRICQARCVGDVYGFEAAKIHTPAKLKKILKGIAWTKINKKDGRQVGNLIMAAVQLAYAYFSDYFYAQCFELAGPYPMADGTMLIIRKFQNFHPLELWRNGPFPKFHTLEIYSAYNAKKIIIDQWSHIQSNFNLAQSLKRAAVVVDGKQVNLSDIPPLLQDLGNCAAEIQNQWKNFDPEAIKQLMLALRWYQYKPITGLVNLPWQPTKAMRLRIKSQPLLPEITPRFSTQKQAQAWWSKLIDPRINNLPKSYIKPWIKK